MTRIAASLTALLLASGAALAQGMTPGDQFLAIWDQDGDGAVSLEEALIRRGDIFAAFDADEDGYFSAEELAALDEMRLAEQATMQGQRAGAEMGQGMGNGKGHGKGKGGPMGLGWDRPAAQEMSGLDRDGDGRIDQNEFLDGTPRWFARMDRNGDGVITAADFGHN